MAWFNILPWWKNKDKRGGVRAGAGRPKGSKNIPREIKPIAVIPVPQVARVVKAELVQAEVIPPPIRTGKRPNIRQFVSDRSVRASVRHLELVRDNKIKFEDVRVSKDGEVVRFQRDPPLELRNKAAEWLGARRIAPASPHIKAGVGDKVLTVILHPNEPEI